jgi:hypothetical protein
MRLGRDQLYLARWFVVQVAYIQVLSGAAPCCSDDAIA